MEINEIQEFVSERLHDGGKSEPVGLHLIAAKLGQYAETQLRIAAAPPGAVPSAVKEEIMGDILASAVVVVAHAAEDEGLDLEKHVAKRLEQMKEVYEKQERFTDALREGDLDAIEEMVRDDLDEEDLLAGDDPTDPEGSAFY